MNYYDIENQKKDVYPAIVLDEVLSFSFRKILRKILIVASCITICLFVFTPRILSEYIYLLRSISVLLISSYISMQLLEAMYRSYYFEKNEVDIRVLKILNNTKDIKDLTEVFLNHEMGRYALYRLGITDIEIEEFLKNKKDVVTIQEFEIIENDDNTVSFAEFGFSLVHFDSDFIQFLRHRGITVLDFKQTLEWVARLDKKIREQERWWLKDNLLRIPSIGKNLSFGQVYYLERFGHTILSDTTYIQLGEKYRLYKTSVDKIESVLSKDVGANILLSAKESYICMDAVASLGKEILRGTVLPSVENKRIYVLDANSLVSTYENTSDFETMFNQVLIQAANAGNVILVLPNFPEFVQHVHTLGINAKAILDEVLRSSNLQVIVTSSERLFHEVLETDIDLMSSFEKIQLEEFDEYQAISLLQDEVLYAEHKEHVFFTFQAIKRIIESADRYFTEASLSDKSIDILYEVIPTVRAQNKMVITQEDIDSLVTSKTGISLGKISKDESQKLSHLKEEMQKKVIGQSLAIEAVCDAMLRARAGLANPKRPLASFMFVGPTGVGKTETAKALAGLFFNDEENMLRSDMTEYSDSGALARMIGGDGVVGVFASKVRERGHGVLLLDEFEKASSEVHDLFLQIIDEGFFTDGRGEKVSMRNFIIIATSNAGSEILYNQNQEHLVTKQELIDYIIQKQILRTELLNRFDDIILFNSLTVEELVPVAQLMVTKLAKRLDQRGITLKESPDLINHLVKAGNNPKFGAREMNRVIIKELESKIAQALILGDLFEGDTISFVISNSELEIQKYS